jgi:hypothetical protein
MELSKMISFWEDMAMIASTEVMATTLSKAMMAMIPSLEDGAVTY